MLLWLNRYRRLKVRCREAARYPPGVPWSRRMAERLQELDALPGLAGEYLRELPYLLWRGAVIREYEILVSAKRTLENPLEAYPLTPENVHSLSEEELAEEAPQR